MSLRHIAEGGSFDVAAAIRLLAAKVGVLTGEVPALATMDAADAGAMLDASASATGSAKKPAGKKKATDVASATEVAGALEVAEVYEGDE